MKFIKSNQGELIKGNGFKKDVLLKDIDLLSNKALVQLIIIEPHEVAKNHYHKKSTEIFYFLEGQGIFIINGRKIKCLPGDVLVCEKNEVHSTRNESDQVWKYLAFKTYNSENDSFWL